MVTLSLVLLFVGCGSRVSWELLKADCVPTTEIWYDGIDQDCAGGDDFDQDGDGVPVDEDCWDDPNDETFLGEAVGGGLSLSAAEVFPGAEDAWYDGVDQDCGGENDFDQDGDGFESANDEQADGSVGDDCVDGSSTTNPGVYSDSCWEGVDNDCDGVVDEGSFGTPCYSASGGELVISELFISGSATDDPKGEWFEVYNPHPTRTVYMESMSVTRQHKTASDVSFIIDEVVELAPKGTAVFCFVATDLNARCDFEYGTLRTPYFELTQDTNSTLVITTSAGDVASRTLDRVNYDGTPGFGKAGLWPGVISGYSYELSNTWSSATSNDDGASWCNTTGNDYTDRLCPDCPVLTLQYDYGTPNATNTCP